MLNPWVGHTIRSDIKINAKFFIFITFIFRRQRYDDSINQTLPKSWKELPILRKMLFCYHFANVFCTRADISSFMKNTKAEPSIVPSSGINSPIINVVVIVSNFAI